MPLFAVACLWLLTSDHDIIDTYAAGLLFVLLPTAHANFASAVV